MPATERARSMVRRPTASIGNIKRRIGYDTEDDDIHDMRRGIVNMAMNIDVGLPDSDDLGILHEGGYNTHNFNAHWKWVSLY